MWTSIASRFDASCSCKTPSQIFRRSNVKKEDFHHVFIEHKRADLRNNGRTNFIPLPPRRNCANKSSSWVATHIWIQTNQDSKFHCVCLSTTEWLGNSIRVSIYGLQSCMKYMLWLRKTSWSLFTEHGWRKWPLLIEHVGRTTSLMVGGLFHSGWKQSYVRNGRSGNQLVPSREPTITSRATWRVKISKHSLR